MISSSMRNAPAREDLLHLTEALRRRSSKSAAREARGSIDANQFGFASQIRLSARCAFEGANAQRLTGRVFEEVKRQMLMLDVNPRGL